MKVFILDNYDSFTFNLAEYFKLLGAQVVVYRNDVPVAKVKEEAPNLLVLSPGPSVPRKAGNLIPVIETYAGQIPIFGVCLGHQAMIEAFGGSLKLLDYPVHGKASPAIHHGDGIFKDLPNPLMVGRYHSLIADQVPDCFEVTAKTGEVVMAISHKTLKVIGVQFHPESILTAKADHGLKLLKNLVTLLG
ncbi:MAG: anthranilate synthase component II [Candidatus Lambdaproteobacteria bacterium RIFOXYD12_FULL_49_8]|uniref:Anthranilate synthase component II n=1 Tax=Candidatus Lambdaproteobacteria bacterium RIFOXYD2_FULL_50_16 TaxID=1817772 RepID=A0A1F6GAH6_9PROT|nr:MAG: anthranilate synthase component II [Candidatus Lambdaproteobacteria bacterium RIFOXYD2_FULL_50_16]OGG98067.1 MAG: anthranilate synthase component II [Candidatus Lambdaproteobacteria bacterium RIFOXYD12_FULL_49_8]